MAHDHATHSHAAHSHTSHAHPAHRPNPRYERTAIDTFGSVMIVLTVGALIFLILMALGMTVFVAGR